MLKVHHLGRSQSDRVVWLCEELGIPYEMVKHDRDLSGLAPPAYKALHFYGTAPIIQDGDVTLGESGAIVEYICRQHAGGRLTVEPGAANFAQYLYWLHFANGSFAPSAIGGMSADASEGGNMWRRRYDRAFDMVEQRLGKVPYFAGADLTAADIMMVFPLTAIRAYVPRDISGSPNTLAYLQRIGARPAFQRACKMGDPGIAPNLT